MVILLEEFKIITGNANKLLVEKVTKSLETEIANITVSTFSDGETSVSFNETVRGSRVFVIQSTCPPVNDNVMELLLMLDAAKRCSAKYVSAIVPYYGYSRQDRMVARSPISARIVADAIQNAGADHFVSIDLHNLSIAGFFNVPFDGITAIPILSAYFKQKDLQNAIVVSPDAGGVKRARQFANRLLLPIAIVDKLRPRANESTVNHVVGDIEGKDCILVDDLVDTAGSITNAAQALLEKGANKVYGAVTHPVLSRNAFERIEKSGITELVVTDTIPLKADAPKKITQISVAPMLVQCIKLMYENKSLSALW